MKPWGRSEYWGLGAEYDPDWVLTEAQKQLRAELIELCRTKIRPRAPHFDRTYEYPRASMNDLAELRLLGLQVPEELGGRGENHVCVSMVAETIARYGCPSTAMVYCMHQAAVTTMLFRHHSNPRIRDLLSRLDKEKLVGTVVFSDPATGTHFWYPLSSKVRQIDEDTVQMLKVASWATSAGLADWYSVQTVSPQPGHSTYSNLSIFLVFKDEVRASTDNWSAMGMHGNQSGPLVVEGKFPLDRMVGPAGDGGKSNDECGIVYFTSLASAWNGIALACLDVAKKHVTRKAHADMGMRVCDYPTVQDYFGECIINTNASRGLLLLLLQAVDAATRNNKWALHSDLSFLPRTKFQHWLWQAKFTAAKNVVKVSDKMLFACGGSGYRTELGLERLLRDGKSGWVMGPTNEVIRQLVGKSALNGFASLDPWQERADQRVLQHEMQKLTLEEKGALAQKLLQEVEAQKEGAASRHPYQDTDFDNPFNTRPPACVAKTTTSDGVQHDPALRPDSWTALKLLSRADLTGNMAVFTFALPKSTDHTGCLPGQYVMVRVAVAGKEHLRYFSPVSRPDDFGRIELVLKFETQGVMSRFFQDLKSGDQIDFQGPCGGLEYEANTLTDLTVLASGAGVTPGLQLVRCVAQLPEDETRITLLYFSETVDEFLCREELDRYCEKDSRIRVVYSVGEAPQDWEGEEGFINTDLISKHVPEANSSKHKVVVCGGVTMSISCLHSLRSLGYKSSSIFVFGQFGAELVRSVYGKTCKLSTHLCGEEL
ncbi:uncharacterized protein [Penaeus vannamei]|uniref:uncharacterized protein n=1 Tax=Penaeus vannamei TaxID=6689 RepID=UPI00387F8528